MSRPRITFLHEQTEAGKSHPIVSILHERFELVKCYEESFRGNPHSAAQWISDASDMSAVLIDLPTSVDFQRKVIELLNPLLNCPLIVVGTGLNDGNLVWTGTSEPGWVNRTVNLAIQAKVTTAQ